MLTRAFTKPVKRSPRHEENQNVDQPETTIFYEYEDCLVGFMDDIPLVAAFNGRGSSWSPPPTMREVLRASVGVMGMSCLGMTEKVVFLGGRICAVKRFREVRLRRAEFGWRIMRTTEISRRCEHLVPVTAYLYSKRIKFVLCDYYPMGSLADLLAGSRQHGHTALDWNQRLRIVQDIARTIAFIHSQSPAYVKRMHLNVHGNIKSSNVMINIDFSACLSEYGFAQLAGRVEIPDMCQPRQGSQQPQYQLPHYVYSKELSQKGDIYNFGLIVLDILGGPEAVLDYKNCIVQKDGIRDGSIEFFEFLVEGKEKKHAVQLLEIGLACINQLDEERPSIEQILLSLGSVVSNL
ncbi:probable inactive receptor kinase At3g08680 [Punica granatum]|uniref:Protein kinase domain-containing protein n=2 Tax=Punica granatum TaxID=22663 RepID=A0A218WI32_PUNGR|nr:probable inactive receptor kinase At3g08680 [Punica granatum]OWM72168.1 hypothetical protein CDL15_Pgr018051 [Punica granatum]PKI77923.1 hypothetical protein CRG98_001715 [Punica granatum]